MDEDRVDIVKYADGWAMTKDGVEIIFYNKVTDTYFFKLNPISSEDLEWFRDILH